MTLCETSSAGTRKRYDFRRFMTLGDMTLGDITYVQNIGDWVGTGKKYDFRRFMTLGDMTLGETDCMRRKIV